MKCRSDAKKENKMDSSWLELELQEGRRKCEKKEKVFDWEEKGIGETWELWRHSGWWFGGLERIIGEKIDHNSRKFE